MTPSKKQPTDLVTHQDIVDLKESIDRWRVIIQAKIEKHDETLFGNGKPGMDEQIRNLTNYMELLVKLAWIVVGGVVTITLSGTAYAIIYIIREGKP